VELAITQEILFDPLRSALMYQGIEAGKDTWRRVMPFENCAVVNPIGMVNLGDSLAAIKKQKRVRIWEHVEQVGKTVHNDWETLGKKHNLPIKISGFPCLAHFSFTENARELKTLYTVLMLKRGFLGNVQIDPTLAHTPEILALYRSAIDEVFAEISSILKKGSYDEILKAIGGPVCHAGFGRLIP